METDRNRKAAPAHLFAIAAYMLLQFAAKTICEINSHLSNPKPGHTTGGSRQGGARRAGGAERGRAGRDADGLVRPEEHLPSSPPKHRKQFF